MGIIAIIPTGLLNPKKEDEVILWLQELKVPDRRKKQALVEWCQITGVALTKEMVEKLFKRI